MTISTSSLIVIIVILFILFSQFRERKFRLWTSIFTMLFMLFITILFINIELTNSSSYPILLFGGLLGVFIGLAIAHHIKIKISDKGTLITRGSFISVSIWIFIILVKFYGQDTFNQWGWDPNLLLSFFLVMSVSTIISRNIYLYHRFLDKKRNTRFTKKG